MLTSVSFIGGGNMATAMIAGLRRLAAPPQVCVAEPDPEKRARFAAQGILATAENTQAVAAGAVVVLAVKPQVMAAVLPEIAAAWTPGTLLVSILAGTTTARLESLLPAGAAVVRAMPNTPLAIGQGMVGLCPGAHARAEHLALAEALFAPCGKVLRVADESRMDAITAVSGSGPAYVFQVAEHLVTAAMGLGFDRAEAELLVGQTLSGSVAYLMQQGIASAGELRRAVTSPGGTTAAALAELERSGMGEAWIRALAAARARGAELAKA